MDRTLKALSLLLSYPSRALQQAMPEIGGVLAETQHLGCGSRIARRGGRRTPTLTGCSRRRRARTER